MREEGEAEEDELKVLEEVEKKAKVKLDRKTPTCWGFPLVH